MAKLAMDALNEAQQQAVWHVDGPLLMLAGPGSGKTRVITHRIAYLLEQGVPSWQIIALTFTNKAAEEMTRRVQTLAPEASVWMGTFHRFGSRLLRQYAALAGLTENFSILDTEDSRRALREATSLANIDLTHCTLGQLVDEISGAKSRLIEPDQFTSASTAQSSLASKAYPYYQRLLRESNAVDFDDLLMLPALMLRDNPELRARLDDRFRYILVDEYQDTNPAQYAIVRSLSNLHPNLAVTGDPDQSIYGWRGATLDNILSFERDYPAVRVVKLEQNYRSTPEILSVADALIAHNRQRKPKRLWTTRESGAAVRLAAYPTARDEARDVVEQIELEITSGGRSPEELAIFYRTNALSLLFERELAERGIPYQIVRGVEFYQRKEVKDCLAYLHLLNNPSNELALLRVINTPARGIGAKTIERLQAYAEEHGLPLLDAARRAGLVPKLAKRAAVRVARFVATIDELMARVHEPVEDLLRAVLANTGYREALESSKSEEDADRLENLDELLSAAREHQERFEEGGLESFLEQTALVSDTDVWDAKGGRVSLMTLHAAKGLEFDSVFLVAVEAGRLPHERSRDDPDQLEEERRLMFVGVTRARESLQISYAMRRHVRGEPRPVSPSRFLMELPTDQMEVRKLPGSYGRPGETAEDAFSQESSWEEPSFDIHDSDDHASDDRASDDRAGDVHAGDVHLSDVIGSELQGGAAPATTNADVGNLDRFGQLDPSTLLRGMLVEHPDYGMGRIQAIEGADAKRVAKIQFQHDVTRTIFVTYCPLRIVSER